MRQYRNRTASSPWILNGVLLVAGIQAMSIQVMADVDAVEVAVAAIKKAGGSARRRGDEWEVDFHLRGRALSNEGLRNLVPLKNVVWLNLSQTNITSDGLAHLRRLKKLRWLHLEKTKIDDRAVPHLSALTRLEYLNLYGTSITDRTLEGLAACKGLRRLYVWRTKVTDKGVARLQRALPKLKIVRGVDLSKLESRFPPRASKSKPKLALEWVAVSRRSEAPARSENGVNCQILFENKSKHPVKVYWIMYGGGGLKFYFQLAPGKRREQNSYSRNVWLISDMNDQPLGYFVVKQDDAHAVIPARK